MNRRFQKVYLSSGFSLLLSVMSLCLLTLSVGCEPDILPVDLSKKPIGKTYEKYFSVGVAIEPPHLKTFESILASQFQRLTCENAMKMNRLQPQEGKYTFEQADKIADYARKSKKPLTGHTLLWHSSTPAWMFAGLTPGKKQDIELIKKRLQKHIETVVKRYADVVDNWDVVNEAISDNANKVFRDDKEGSAWFALFGGNDDGAREYIYWAFKYTKDTLEKIKPGSSKGKLYYNDYNVTQKLDKILKLLKWLKDERGLKIDGVGLQGHWTLDWPSVSTIASTIDAIVAAGYKVKISELDITIYDDYTSSGALQPEPEKVFSKALEKTQGLRYRELFALFRQKSQAITSVTFWGVADDQTWLDGHPVSGRNNFPLLFNDKHQPKDAAFAIVQFEE